MQAGMKSISKRLLATLAAMCATAVATHAVPEARAQEFLEEATTVANRLCRCPATADDLVGETARKLLARHTDVLVGASDAERRAYVRRCVENTLRDELRKSSRRRPLADLDEIEPPFHAQVAPPDVAAELEIEEFLTYLTPEDREVLELMEEGVKERGIAARIDQTRHSVRRSMERIRHAANSYFFPSDRY